MRKEKGEGLQNSVIICGSITLGKRAGLIVLFFLGKVLRIPWTWEIVIEKNFFVLFTILDNYHFPEQICIIYYTRELPFPFQFVLDRFLCSLLFTDFYLDPHQFIQYLSVRRKICYSNDISMQCTDVRVLTNNGGAMHASIRFFPRE